MVQFEGKRNRFDQAVGQGWMILAIGRNTEGLLSAAQIEVLSRLDGRLLSLGPAGAGCDVTTLDTAYVDWMAEVDGNYAILRPDFYVAATAKTPEQLRACFDAITGELHLITQ